MFDTNSTIYPSKVLLFGEHLLLHGCPALAVPFRKKGGYWTFIEDENREKQQNLKEFAQSPLLKNLKLLDMERFQSDVALGLSFESNIPIGYGLGSSGALCAAVYDAYAYERNEDLDELKKIFAQMESFFHGSSSGIDPLTSYVDAPLCFDTIKSEAYDLESLQVGAWQPYLLDTGIKRQTGTQVYWFAEKMKEEEFKVAAQNMILFTHSLILMLLSGEEKEREFGEKLHWLSDMQYNFLYDLIPEKYWEDWARGLESQEYFMKLCGAGGGGYILVWAKKGFRPPIRWNLEPLELFL